MFLSIYGLGKVISGAKRTDLEHFAIRFKKTYSFCL